MTSGKRDRVAIRIRRDQQKIYHEAIFTNDLKMAVTEDSTTYEFRKLELMEKIGSEEGFEPIVTDSLNITMVAEQPSAFNFQIKDSWGDFKNGQCEIQ